MSCEINMYMTVVDSDQLYELYCSLNVNYLMDIIIIS